MPPKKTEEDEYDELLSDYEDEFLEEEEDDPKVFRIRGALEAPNAKIYTMGDLHALIHQGLIDLNAPYQREVVWNDMKQSALIDSIFRNYYVPPILFSLTKEKDEDGEEYDVKTCMDGKQRLTSIVCFMDGMIPYKDPLTKKKYWYVAPTKSGRTLLPPKFKDEFALKQIACVEYPHIGAAAERSIFQRVQMGVSLTAAEKLQAIDSPWSAWISQLDMKHIRSHNDSEEGDEGIAKLISWNIARGRNYQCLAQMVYCVENIASRAEPTVSKLESWLSRVDPPGHELRERIEKALTDWWNIASEPSLRYPFSKITAKVAPVEFVFIGILLVVLRRLDVRDIAEEIFKMRQYVRVEHKDIRANGRVISTLWDFINQARLRAESKRPANGVLSPPGLNGTPSRKRRKRSVDGGSDDEYQGSPMRSMGPAPKTRAKGTP